MRKLKDVVDDGFSLSDRGSNLKDLGFLSLKIALDSYFSTYHSMKFRLHVFDDKDLEPNEIDYQHNRLYFRACTETIIHFQHFAELIIKEILRSEHPLLANEAASRPLILYKLLKRRRVTSSEFERINSIEFKDALDRLLCLFKADLIKGTNKKLDFILRHKEALVQLNILRNRMWHRGTYVLRYPALDDFVGNYVLPFVNEIINLSKYAKQLPFWKYPVLQCKIDPIEEIINIYKSGVISLGKLALLKELGRAAYANPIHGGAFSKYFDESIRARAKRIAEGEAKGPDVEKISICPVCGVKSLVVYSETYSNADDLNDGEALMEPYKVWRYTSQVKCMCCTFEIYRNDIDNPSTYGLPIEDYWQSTQIQ